MVVLSIVIIYPLLITVLSAFKSGNVGAFTLDFSGNLSFDNFSKLFSETHYGTWYMNTLVIAIITMIVQTSIVTFAGYAYSRYNFLARKQSLVFFLIIQMVPTMAALTAFFVMAFDAECLEPTLVLDLPFVGGGIPMNAWLMKGYFDTVPISLDESAKLDGWTLPSLLANRPSSCSSNDCRSSTLGFHGAFRDYILSKFLLRDEVNYNGSRWSSNLYQ